jgi:hypothetical protein
LLGFAKRRHALAPLAMRGGRKGRERATVKQYVHIAPSKSITVAEAAETWIKRRFSNDFGQSPLSARPGIRGMSKFDVTNLRHNVQIDVLTESCILWPKMATSASPCCGLARTNRRIEAALKEYPATTWVYEILERLQPRCSMQKLRRRERDAHDLKTRNAHFIRAKTEALQFEIAGSRQVFDFAKLRNRFAGLLEIVC